MIDLTADENYYDVLGIEPHATAADLRRRYRLLMQKEAHHPDLGGDTELAALINKAYAVLCNPGLRRQYDAGLGVLSGSARGFLYDVRRAPSHPSDDGCHCAFCATPQRRTVIDDPESRCGSCGSPLHPASADRFERWDQRAIARVPRELPVRFFTGPEQVRGFAAHTEDLSLAGMRLVGRVPVRPGHRIRLVTTVLEAVGDVVRTDRRRTGWRNEHVAGIAFVTRCMRRTTGAFVSDEV